MVVHCVRRDSRGCVLDNCVLELLAEEGFCREVRRVSWRPGAEGAPRGREDCD